MKLSITISFIITSFSVFTNKPSDTYSDFTPKINAYEERCTKEYKILTTNQNLIKYNKLASKKNEGITTKDIYSEIFNYYGKEMSNLLIVLEKTKQEILEIFNISPINNLNLAKKMNSMVHLDKYCIGISNYIKKFKEYLKGTTPSNIKFKNDFDLEMKEVIENKNITPKASILGL